MRSNLLTSTANSFTDVTVKSNRTGNIPRRLRGIVCSPLYAPVNVALCASILSAYSYDAAYYKQFARIGFTPLYTTLTCLEPSFNTTARSLRRDAATFSSWLLLPSFRNRTEGGALSLPAEPVERDINESLNHCVASRTRTLRELNPAHSLDEPSPISTISLLSKFPKLTTRRLLIIELQLLTGIEPATH